MPLLWLSLAFISGIIISSQIQSNWLIWAGLGLLTFGIGLFETRWTPLINYLKKWRKYSPLPLGIVLAAVFLGLARFQAVQPNYTSHDLAWFNDRGSALLIGQLFAPPDWRDNAVTLYVRVSQITLLEEKNPSPKFISGDMLVYLPTNQGWKYGDVVEIEGNPITPPENDTFSYLDYLSRHGIYTYLAYPKIHLLEHKNPNVIMTYLYNFRDYSYTIIRQLFPQPESALLGGILLGIDNDLPDDLQQSFRNTGTSHIYAISGFNIAIIASLFTIVFNRLIPNRWLSMLVTMISITFYTLLVGAGASVVRAAIMGGISLLGRQIGRRQAGANTLTFTAAVMCLFDPWLLWDVGFQLSFAGTLGLILYADVLQEGFARVISRFFPENTVVRLTTLVGDYVLLTLAAQITTLPVIAYNFRQISISSFIANILILPPQPLVMILGGITLLVGLVIRPLGQILAYVAWVPLAYTTRVVEGISNLWKGVIPLGDLSIWVVSIYYIIVISLRLFWKHIKPTFSKITPTVSILGTAILSVIVWLNALSSPDGKFHITVFYMDNANPILIQTAEGRAILINASSSTRQLSSMLERRLGALNPNLDALILTDPSANSLQGVSALFTRFSIQQVLLKGTLTTNRSFYSLDTSMRQKHIPEYPLVVDQQYNIGGGSVLEVLADTDAGTTLGLRWDSFHLIIPGGFPLESLKYLGDWLSSPSLLVLNPNDMKSHTAQDWNSLNPILVTWDGKGFLTTETQKGSWIDGTEHGWISISTNGSQMWIETQR